MKVILFGATGMVGHGALQECLRDGRVDAVVAVGRNATGVRHAKLSEITTPNLTDLSVYEARLSGFDACLFCLGVSSVGMAEADYRCTTYDLTLSVARALLPWNPRLSFVYVSGSGTDSTAKGSSMWARVKGETENALLAMPFRSAYMFRPGYIQPVDGFTGKTWWIRALYGIFAPLYPLLKAVAPNYATTTQVLARAMLRATREGAPVKILETPDINRLGSGA
jgi:uncharacterized protein YbjT (DUF2867 family)